MTETPTRAMLQLACFERVITYAETVIDVSLYLRDSRRAERAYAAHQYACEQRDKLLADAALMVERAYRNENETT